MASFLLRTQGIFFLEYSSFFLFFPNRPFQSVLLSCRKVPSMPFSSSFFAVSRVPFFRHWQIHRSEKAKDSRSEKSLCLETPCLLSFITKRAWGKPFLRNRGESYCRIRPRKIRPLPMSPFNVRSQHNVPSLPPAFLNGERLRFAFMRKTSFGFARASPSIESA